MMRTTLFLALCISSFVSGRIVTWTGAGGNGLWGFGPNWDQGVIPTAQDDVLFNSKQNQTVTISAPALAYSISLGETTPAPIILRVLSSLTVGEGGVEVHSPSGIVLQASTSTPFSCDGSVNFNGTETFRFITGSITGRGAFNVLGDSSISFLNPGEKLIDGTVIYNNGEIHVFATAGPIQLERKGRINSIGDIKVKGNATFLSVDGTGLLQSEGKFHYSGIGSGDRLILQARSSFETGLNATVGILTVEAAVLVKGIYVNSSVLVLGNGALSFNGNATGTTFSVARLFLQSGSVFTNNAFLQVGTVYATNTKITNTGFINTTTFFLGSSSIAGSGRITTDLLDFAAADGATSLDSSLYSNEAYITGFQNVLFSKGANLTVAKGFVSRYSFNFQLVSGSPVVYLNGSVFFINVTVYTTVNISGNANYSIDMNSSLTLQAASLSASYINLTSSVLNAVATPSFKVGTIVGNGTVSIQANPSASIGSLQAKALAVSAGNVVATNFTVQQLNLTNGAIQFVKDSYAKTFNFWGGAISTTNAGVSLSTTNTTLAGPQAKTLNQVHVVARNLEFECGQQCNVLFQNGATIGTQ